MIKSPISQEKKQVVENIFSLFTIQGAMYILPLITLPYLVRVLGPAKYGLVAFAQAFIQYFIVITDYGFIHTAPRKVAISRDNNEKLIQVFNSIMLIKIVLLLISFIILLLVIILFSKFRSDWNLYLITFLAVPSNIFFPAWFFQGMEKMKYISSLNILARIIFTAAIFIFVREQADYLYVPLLNSLGAVTAGIISLWIIVKKFGIKMSLPQKTSVYTELKEGWHVFLGMSAVSVYTQSNVFILGLFSSSAIVGYYRAADAIVKAFISLLSPISQAMYPYISRLAIISEKKAVNIIKKLFFGVGGFTIIIGIILFIFAPYIVKILLGPKYTESVIVLRILSLLPFLIGTSGLVATLGLLAFNMNKVFSRIVISVGIVNLVLAFILTPMYKHIGMSITLLISEMIATSAVILCFKYKRPHGTYIVKDENAKGLVPEVSNIL